MSKIKNALDSIKQHSNTLEEHGSNILSHGKDIIEKGKDLVNSKEGLSVIKFAKNKLSKNKNSSSENNISLSDVLEIGNRVKDIVEKDITPISNDVVDLKNELLEADSQTQDNNSSDDTNISVLSNDELAEEDAFFENSLNTLLNASQNGYLNLNNPEEVLRAFNTLQMVANETIKYVEEQETKRVEINAQRDIAIEKIKVIENAITTYLEKTFDERGLIFSKQFEAVDTALKNNNTEQLAISLNSINSLAAQSPFKALADLKSVQKQLLETDSEWDI